MGLHEDFDESSFTDHNYKDEFEDLPHKKRVRRMLEDKLERRRLMLEMKDEFDELDKDEFDWGDLEK
jgi:hypothetical protein